MAKLSDDELLKIVEGERTASIGFWYGQLSKERQTAVAYYNGQPYGNEVEGRSQFVSTEVLDTIEWVMPSLMRIFASGDEVVKFEPKSPEDEFKAKQCTEYINHIFQKQNNGFVALYSWFKDALLQKNGFIKVYWDEYEESKKESYVGLTDDEFTMLVKDDGVEVLEHEARTQTDALGTYQVHDVTIRVTNKKGKACIEPVPPEEVLINRDARMDIQKARYVAHRKKTNPSELKLMGFSESEIEGLQSDDNNDYNQEHLERWKLENDFTQQNYQTEDEAMRPIWITDAYIRVDYDGDGIAELRRVMHVGNKILENEEIDRIPLVSITPIIMPHKLFGKSVADLVMDLQLLKSTVFRQILDNMYLQNNGRWMALDGMVNMDDLLTSRPGGIVRVKAFDAVKRLDSPMLGAPAFNLLEYIDTIKENRTGVTKYNQGLDSDSLNKTAHGISLIQNASAQRVELIARVFAETGVKDLFYAILELISKHQNKPEVVRLTNGWVPIDPRDWAGKFDISVTVGLGSGNKEQEAQAIQEIIKLQMAFLQTGLPIVNPENLYASAEKLKAAIGQKNSNFFTDPKTVPPSPPKQDPKITEIMAKAHAEGQLKMLEAQISQQQPKDNQAQIQAEAQLRSDAMKAQHEQQLLAMKSQYEAQLAEAQRGFDAWVQKLQADTKVTVAEVAAKTTVATTAMSLNAQNGMTESGEDGTQKPASALTSLLDDINNNFAQLIQGSTAQIQSQIEATNQRLEQHGKVVQALQAQSNKPKRQVAEKVGNKWVIESA